MEDKNEVVHYPVFSWILAVLLWWPVLLTKWYGRTRGWSTKKCWGMGVGAWLAGWALLIVGCTTCVAGTVATGAVMNEVSSNPTFEQNTSNLPGGITCNELARVVDNHWYLGAEYAIMAASNELNLASGSNPYYGQIATERILRKCGILN